MPIEASCQGCQKLFRVKDEYAGKRMRCPACKGVVTVPDALVAEVVEVVESVVVAKASLTGRTRGRTERDYTHRACGSSTTIDGPEFEAMADPLAKMVSTYCEKCDDYFPVDQFAWSDTQEKISDYYLRYQKKASAFQKFLASRMGMFALAGLFFVLGLVGALLLKNIWVAIAGPVLSIVAIVLHTLVIGPWVLKSALGTSDARELN